MAAARASRAQLSDARVVINVACNWLRVTGWGIIYRVRTFCFVSGASTWVLELLVSVAPPGRIGVEFVVPWRRRQRHENRWYGF